MTLPQHLLKGYVLICLGMYPYLINQNDVITEIVTLENVFVRPVLSNLLKDQPTI